MTNESNPSQELTNVHQALADASTETQKPAAMETFSVRLPSDLIGQAQEICTRHATTLSAYLRNCAKALVRDYTNQ